MVVKIALIGAMRSGKDTFAEPLLEQGNICHLKFAGGIKRIIKQYFSEIAEQGKPRELYQQIGQCFRQLDPDVWVKDLEEHYHMAIRCHAENFIITDVRQPNEAQWCRDNGFTLVRIHTPEEVRKQRIINCGDQFEPEQFYHETELYINSYSVDYNINGNCSKEELQQKAVELYEQLLKESVEQ